MTAAIRLAIVSSHPVQYYAPWFRHLAAQSALELRVFYLWEGAARHDPGFSRGITWDLDLLSGYDHEFVPNTARAPGTEHFRGLANPSLPHCLRSWHPDIVLVFGYGWQSPAMLALTWKDCPLILRGDTHLLGRKELPAWRRLPQRWLTRLLLMRYAGFACVGQAHRAFLAAHGVPPHRIFHVPHCVDNARWRETARVERTSAAAFRASLGIPARHRVILFAGKFETKKQPRVLLEAFQRSALPDTILLMVGDGPLRDALQQRYSNLASVRWLPFQNQLHLPRIYAAADLFVLPSAGHAETWGLSVNEAMASGLPCIVSDQVGCRADLIIEGETGWSFPAMDVATLADRLSHAVATLSDETALARMRAAVATRIGNYSYDVATANLAAALPAIIAQPT